VNFVREITTDIENNCIRLEVTESRKISKIVEAIKEAFKEIKVRTSENRISITPKGEVDIRELQRIKERVLDVKVSGISGITNAIVMKEGEEWIINTVGSNFEEVLRMKEVDASRTYSNNIHEVAAVLGIEAARNLIIKEVQKTLNEQGLDVNIRHLMLVSDIMTSSGEVRPIGRYGVAGAKTSVLSRAAFEETLKHLTKASIKNESDEFRGIFENVMIGSVVPSGTGMFDLIAKFEEE
jgi:DNA-directed RNA polymerase subunit A"